MLLYDNKYTGWISSVTTNGTAHITIPATGAIGKHIISVIHGADTFPYLNSQESPHPKPEFHLVYTITKGTAILPKAPILQGLAKTSGVQPSGTGSVAWVNPSTGSTNQPLDIQASNLPAGQSVKIVWQTMVGSHVTASGYALKAIPLGDGTVDQNGALNVRLTPPSDLGGTHKISIENASGTVLASTSYTVTPTAVSMSPTKGPVGTKFNIHLLGVGWTDTSNIYTLDYDNDYMGYVCGFNSQGDVTIPLTAVGQPGWHYIDLYPAVYMGTDIKGTDDFRLPELTYTDHPGEKLPVFHFAFYVTK